MKRIALIVAALFVAACGDSTGPGARITDFGVAKQKWASQGMHNYTFTLTTVCFCANVHPTRVTVVRDTARTAVDLVTNQSIDPRQVYTIDGLFAFIIQQIQRPADKLDVTYDRILGFPAIVDYDGRFSTADDEMYIEVRDVVRMETF